MSAWFLFRRLEPLFVCIVLLLHGVKTDDWLLLGKVMLAQRLRLRKVRFCILLDIGTLSTEAVFVHQLILPTALVLVLQFFQVSDHFFPILCGLLGFVEIEIASLGLGRGSVFIQVGSCRVCCKLFLEYN